MGGVPTIAKAVWSAEDQAEELAVEVAAVKQYLRWLYSAELGLLGIQCTLAEIYYRRMCEGQLLYQVMSRYYQNDQALLGALRVAYGRGEVP